MNYYGQTTAIIKWVGAAVKYGLFALMILVWAFPVIWVIVTSLKVRTDIFTLPPKIFLVQQ